MTFARIGYGIAVAYGTFWMLPLYPLFEELERDARPPIIHGQFGYGFAGLELLWNWSTMSVRDTSRPQEEMTAPTTSASLG